MKSANVLKVLLVLVSVVSGGPMALGAENIDPNGDGSQYAYGENIGWLNAEPLGDGGAGVRVDDFELTGFLWGENIGWVSLSCKNTLSCDSVAHGVINNGSGMLSGYGWSENAGWVNFRPLGAGVNVNPATGRFSGRAWAENVGWITFGATSPVAYGMTTAWRCSPAPPVPSAAPVLQVQHASSMTTLSWTSPAGATGFDVVRGSVAALRSSGGNFTTATDACIAENRTTATLSVAQVPSPGNAFWFLVRPANCGGPGSYNTMSGSQVGSRDSEIGASSGACQ